MKALVALTTDWSQIINAVFRTNREMKCGIKVNKDCHSRRYSQTERGNENFGAMA